MERQDLEQMTREQLIAEAERLAIPRPRVLTQPELIDEIIGRTSKNERERAKARGWLGRARDLLARVVERGLHMPEAARALRKDDDKGWPAPPPPLPTVTLAEIYAAQGHIERALAVLDEVIAREPDHREAHQMRARFLDQAQRTRARTRDADAKSGSTDSPATQKAPSTRPNVTEQAAPPPETKAAPATAATDGDAEAAPPTTASAGLVATSTDGVKEGDAPAPASIELGLANTDPAPNLTRFEPAAEDAAAPAPADAEAAPAEAAPSLEEPPLPDRYEVDEIVAIAVDPITLYFYWEVRATTLAHARSTHPDGWLCVRVAAVTATWEGPAVETRDIRVDALHGDRFLRDIQPGSNLRVSLGWHSSGGFEPFAVGAEVSAPRAVPVETVAQEVARWEAEPVVAAFQNPRGEPISLPRSTPAPGAMPRFATPVASAAFTHTWSRPHPEAGPVDTGVEAWGAAEDPVLPHEEEYEEVVLVDEVPGWFEGPGGSSELGRGGPVRRLRPARRRRLIPGAPGRPAPTAWPGGASDLYPGASELPR